MHSRYGRTLRGLPCQGGVVLSVGKSESADLEMVDDEAIEFVQFAPEQDASVLRFLWRLREMPWLYPGVTSDNQPYWMSDALLL